MINEYSKQKQIYKEHLVLVKCGRFYYTYSNDAYIINYFFDYKIIKNKVAFPVTVLEKIKRALEKEKIAYLVIDKNVLHSSTKQKDYKEDCLKRSHNHFCKLNIAGNKFRFRYTLAFHLYSRHIFIFDY